MKSPEKKYEDLIKVTLLTENGMFTYVAPQAVVITKGKEVLYKLLKPETPK